MTRLIIPLIILIAVSSCSINEKNDNYRNSNKVIVNFYETPNDSWLSTFYNMDTLEITMEKLEDSSFTYRSKGLKDTVYSELKIDLKKENATYISEGQQYITHFIDKKIVNIPGRKIYRIYRILDFRGMDSQEFIYWTEEYGIILRKSLYWRSFITYEYLNDNEKNEIIRILCNFIMNDRQFYEVKEWKDRTKYGV